MADTQPSGLARKLGVRAGSRICLLSGPAEGRAALRHAFGELGLVRERLGATRFDLIFFWPKRRSGLEQTFARLERHLEPDGAIWAVLPKKVYAPARGVKLDWSAMQAAGLSGNLVDNKVASLGNSDYATRFVIRKGRRRRPASVR